MINHAKQGELLEMLREIRNVCNFHNGRCKDCSLSLPDEGCILKSRSPKDWILSDEKKTWNAFNPNYPKENTSPQITEQSAEKQKLNYCKG